MASTLRRIAAPFTDEELERLTEQARSRGLSSTSFVRLVVMGAITKGGGTLDQLLVAAEAVNKVPIKAKPGRDFRKDWIAVEYGHRTYRHNEQYTLRLPETRGHGTSAKNMDRDDKALWWFLRRPFEADVPMAFDFREAARGASQAIERGDVAW